MNKTCTKCGETKPTTEFHKDKSKSDGLYPGCKVCRNARNRTHYEANSEKQKARHKDYREANPEKEKARNKAYYEANPEKIKARNKAYYEANSEKIKARTKAYNKTPAGKLREYKGAAKKRGIPFLLTEEEFNSLWQLPCHYCDTEIKTISLDRVDNDGPYHIDNVVPCCWPCNISKSNTTLDEWTEKKNV